jgi:hypothetical protein
MLKIQNCHKNDTIFILGCGPSLTPDVCRTLIKAKATTIGVNKTYKMIKPTYHIHVDYKRHQPEDNFSYKHNKELVDLYDKGTILFAPVDHSLKPTMQTPPHIPFYSCRLTSFKVCYSESMGMMRLGHSTTSIFHALQLAVIMGASKIVLIGVDFYVKVNKQGVGKVHCYSAETKLEEREINRHKSLLPKFEGDLKTKALPLLKERGIEVVNASPKSKLKVFPKAKLEDVLNDCCS